MFSEQNMFLTVEEVERLTGTPVKKLQIAYFKDRGIPVEYDNKGRPLPLRSTIINRYDKKNHSSTAEPNFDTL